MSTTQEIYYPSSADFSFGDPMPDTLIMHTDVSGVGGSMEVQLPQLQGGSGNPRIAIQNPGATYPVYVNAFAGETIAGGFGTYTVEPGQTATLQGGSAGQGAPGWRVK